MSPIYLLIGVPAAGKSWAAEQLKKIFNYVPHDDYIDGGYTDALLEAAASSKKPILAEAPFSISQTKDPLEEEGAIVIPVFIIEDEDTLRERWEERGLEERYQKGHLSRQKTYITRAGEYEAFMGTSAGVLRYLSSLASRAK